ncbi:hypothetical protein N6B72_20415 [Chryseobacterium soli]|uniref:hypothetical protein n=1 Tax=Chryseobacterium soli TaxID=445961 RepID=UPI0029546B76|nr:hypothetical protein [Chryseobacterium soli]MDV7699291.1 hypothetical protein [Chryseobacterium soli]
MKSLLQQLKPNFPLYKRASLLFFLCTIIFTLHAQSFYFVKGTEITIDETATFFITSSGKVNQAGLRDFEGQISVKKQTSTERKRLAFDNKKSRFSSKKDKKQSVSKSSKEQPEISKKDPAEWIKPCPENFISSYQQGTAISASVPNMKFNPKFLLENTTLKPLHGYSANTDHEIIKNNFLFFTDYHLSQHMTRPPPLNFIVKKHILTI